MKLSHKQRVLNHLLEKGSITSWEAIKEYGNTRLSGTIYILKHEGHDIVSISESAINRYGEKVYYTRYVLEGK